jgi:FlaA1/EpsC-like NDP-sugar epimerase
MDGPNTFVRARRFLSVLTKEPILRKAVKITLDSAIAVLAYGIVTQAFRPGRPDAGGTGLFLFCSILAGGGFQLTSQHYRAMALGDLHRLLLGTLALSAGCLALLARPGLWPAGTSPAMLLGACLTTGFLWSGLRLGIQAMHRQCVTQGPPVRERTIIIGAGKAGMKLCQELREHPRLRYRVLGFVDDALDKQGLRVLGVPVLGPTHLLPLYIREQNATLVVLGMTGVRGARIRQLSRAIQAEGVSFKTIPGINDLVGAHPWKPETDYLPLEQVLLREPVEMENGMLLPTMAGEVVLITGAGGSLGSELARRLAALRPAKLILAGRGENSLWEIQRQLADLFPDQRLATALFDLRNPARLERVFEDYRPGVVFHAAGHKHLAMLEDDPGEALENNVVGTRNLINAAMASGVGLFVNASSVHAVRPVGVFGLSKAVGERLVAAAAAEDPGARYLSVRLGELLDSRGGMAARMRDQISRGGPVCVSHPDLTRHLMTVREAAQCMLLVGAQGGSGRVYAMDMGDPVPVARVAEELIRLADPAAGANLELRFTGMSPGDRMAGPLCASGRPRRSSLHPRLLELDTPVAEPWALRKEMAVLGSLLVPEGPDRLADLVRLLRRIVPEYQPAADGLGRWLRPDPAAAEPEGEAAPAVLNLVKRTA